MRALLLFLFAGLSASAQTLVRYDYMETWNWAGVWNTNANTGWYNNASVSSPQSAAITGGGNGTSPIEDNWYRLPNVTGLDASKQYQFRFRLASYTFSNSTATTRGVDAADYVSVQVSTNGGAYINELRITGNTNATWPYNTNGTITHNANGAFSTSPAPTGDVYQSGAGALTNGPSVIALNLPNGITQVAVDIYCRVNSAGEEWWLDNIELWDITPISLPIELIEFSGINKDDKNVLYWSTASEHNNDYFSLYRSNNGADWELLAIIEGAKNSTDLLEYSFIDQTFTRNTITYYMLSQTDFDGTQEFFNTVAINSEAKLKKIVKFVNLRGQEVDESKFTETGIYFEVYEDGTVRRIWR